MTALRQRMLEDMKIRNLALNTQASYLLQVSQFARHFGKSPEVLGPEDIRAYQLHLTQEKKLAPSSITSAVAALRFLYNITLHRDWKMEEIIPAPKKPQILPIILSPEEVLKFLGCIRLNNHRTILTCCYAAGLRISEAIALEATHIDSQRMMIRVEQVRAGKIATSCSPPSYWKFSASGGDRSGPSIGCFLAGFQEGTSLAGQWKTRVKRHTNGAAFPNRLPHTP
jgi:integrase/recombinase XerD